MGPIKKMVDLGADCDNYKNMLIKTDDDGKKYIYQNGKKIELKIINLKPMEKCVGNSKFVENICQTDYLEKIDKTTQTDNYLNNCNSPLIDLCRFILDDNSQMNERDNLLLNVNNMNNLNTFNTQDELAKFNFFIDLNNCLKFNQAGNLPIHESVLQNNVKLVKKNCVILKARQETPNIVNHQFFTPLHLAILNNVNLEIVNVLLQNDADITQTDSNGNSSLHLSVEYNRYDILKLLLENTMNKKINLDLFNYDGLTALMIACINCHYEIALLLLIYGASPNLRDKKCGKTALFYAMETNDVNLVKLLVEYRADTKIRNFFGTSPHDAMFEIESTPLEIKTVILGKEHFSLMRKNANRKKNENNFIHISEIPKHVVPITVTAKNPAKILKTTPILKRISTTDGGSGEPVVKLKKF